MANLTDPAIDQALKVDSWKVIHDLRVRNSKAVDYVQRAVEAMGIFEEEIKPDSVNIKSKVPENLDSNNNEKSELSDIEEIKAKIVNAKKLSDQKEAGQTDPVSKKYYKVNADDIMDTIDPDDARAKIMSLYERVNV